MVLLYSKEHLILCFVFKKYHTYIVYPGGLCYVRHKKDNTKETFNVQKVVVAVNKSAYRALVKFTEEDLNFICSFVEEKAHSLGKEGIHISEMHNIVEGALEARNPAVAKSYRDYRNYKQDFVQMLDEVYKKASL